MHKFEFVRLTLSLTRPMICGLRATYLTAPNSPLRKPSAPFWTRTFLSSMQVLAHAFANRGTRSTRRGAQGETRNESATGNNTMSLNIEQSIVVVPYRQDGHHAFSSPEKSPRDQGGVHPWMQRFSITWSGLKVPRSVRVRGEPRV